MKLSSPILDPRYIIGWTTWGEYKKIPEMIINRAKQGVCKINSFPQAG